MRKIIILCAAVLLLSGCQSQINQNSGTQEYSSVGNGGWVDVIGSSSSGENSSSANQNTSSNLSVENSGAEKKELDQSGFQRNMNINSPLRLPTACKTEKGYYLQNEGLLYFFDNELGRMIVVCGKPECPHNDVDCNAWINSKLLSYCDGKLYYAQGDAIHNSYITLCSMNLDGTGHTDVQVIQVSEPSWSVNCADPILINGMIYFMERDHSVYRVGLGQKVDNAVKIIDGEPEEMHQTSEWKFWADGENAYAMNRYMDNNGDEHDRLYLLGENSANTRKIWSSSQIVNSTSDNASWYIMNGRFYYYASGNELWNVDLSSGNSEKISLSGNTNGGTATFTDENIIILSSNGKEIMVFDYSGAKKANIDLSTIYQTYSDIVGRDLVFVDGSSIFLLAYHKTFMSPSSALYQIDWVNGRLREIDTWPGAAVDFNPDDHEHWIQVG
ncbi:MAG: hypothetical protein K2J80_05970 [Oscillospiraceae bacterium]|nr:hypothetical protein [Oscillospiraceae bacterium]